MEQWGEVPAAPAAEVIEYSLHISNAAKLNLADFQNSVPLLRELCIVNDSDRELLSLQLRLESVPPFLKPKSWSIDACGVKSRYEIQDCDVQLDGALLITAREDAAEVAYAENAAAGAALEPTLFVEADPRAVVASPNPEAFFDSGYDLTLRQMIEYVVNIEGPILDTVLARRIARAHGWQRTGARIQERVSAVARSFATSTDEDIGVFFWPPRRGPEVPVVFRGGANDGRNVDEICIAEPRSLAHKVSVDGRAGDGVIIAMARELGLQRVRAATRVRFESALELVRLILRMSPIGHKRPVAWLHL